MAFCTNCGSKIPEGAKFCAECGTQTGNNGNNTDSINNGNVGCTGNSVNVGNNLNNRNINYTECAESTGDTGVNAFKNTDGVSENHEIPGMQSDSGDGNGNDWVTGRKKNKNSRQSEKKNAENKKEYNKTATIIGIILFVLSLIILLFGGITVIVAALSAAIAVGSVICIVKRCRLKFFPIAAGIIAACCFVYGAGQFNRGAQVQSSGNGAVSEGSLSEGSSRTDTQKENIKGVDPDLKAFLDSYESFVDQYVIFMKKYTADPSNVVSMLGEYSDIMSKYYDFAEKLDKYDSSEMSAEDAKYYLEVTTRCTQKMMDLY